MHERFLRIATLVTLAVSAAPVPAWSQGAHAAPADSLSAWLDSLRQDPNGVRVAPQALRSGSQTVGSADHVAGSIVAVHGTLTVDGAIDGNAVAIGGDVVLHAGSHVGGDAVAVGGQVRDEGGEVSGEMRSLSGFTHAAPVAGTSASRAATTGRSLSLAIGWFVVLSVVGLLTLLLTRTNLETVAERIRTDFSRAFLVGFAGELALLPALVLSLAALAITVIGIILIPFAIIAFLLAAAGLLALGFIAMAYVSGESVLEYRSGGTMRRRAPAGLLLLLGLSIFLAFWLVGALFTWAGIVGAVLRLVAAAVTWVAVTVGFGAALLSRGGTRAPPHLYALDHGALDEEYSWETPTPVTGIAAARPRTPASRIEP
ncbi:MAG TPA: hypothetical protein VFW98_02945 [Gemmatimonadaceae bacterium]|nr:hypothetical protein [Gemmatimonadaceae bacterium]